MNYSRKHRSPILSMREVSKIFKRRSTVYALQNVSLDIYPGDCISIMGPHGAGKSTLLRVLAGYILKSTGKIIVQGRIASVLDIGWGIHPELTGRQNISLAGQMMGAPRSLLRKKKEKIIALSSIGKAIDLPARHYSKNMLLQLAFALVTEIDADILLFDEVLFVGDSTFQRLCEKRLQLLKEQGKALIIVSRTHHKLLHFCDFHMHLRNGRVVKFSNFPSILSSYIRSTKQPSSSLSARRVKYRRLAQLEKTWGIRIRGIECKHVSQSHHESLYLRIRLIVDVLRKQICPNIVFQVHDFGGQIITSLSTLESPVAHLPLAEAGDTYIYTCHSPKLWLNYGEYSLSLSVIDECDRLLFYVAHVSSFSIACMHTELKVSPGVIRTVSHWQAQKSSIIPQKISQL